jgi:hypothetical protein
LKLQGQIFTQIESFWASHQPSGFQMELFGTEAGAKFNPLMACRCDDDKEKDIKLKPTERMQSWDRIADHFISWMGQTVKPH